MSIYDCFLSVSGIKPVIYSVTMLVLMCKVSD